jgi:hypothetical protein
VKRSKKIPDWRIVMAQECSQYIVDSERDDFEDYVLNENDPERHIFSTAYRSLYGTRRFNTLVRELKSQFEKDGIRF